MYSENNLLCGLFVGPAKPNMKVLLQPLTERFDKIGGLGMSLNTPIGQSTFRAKLVLGVFDLPAKAAILCSKQFTGEKGAVCVLILA